jgi:hypothetical protein
MTSKSVLSGLRAASARRTPTTCSGSVRSRAPSAHKLGQLPIRLDFRQRVERQLVDTPWEINLLQAVLVLAAQPVHLVLAARAACLLPAALAVPALTRMSCARSGARRANAPQTPRGWVPTAQQLAHSARRSRLLTRLALTPTHSVHSGRRRASAPRTSTSWHGRARNRADSAKALVPSPTLLASPPHKDQVVKLSPDRRKTHSLHSHNNHNSHNSHRMHPRSSRRRMRHRLDRHSQCHKRRPRR